MINHWIKNNKSGHTHVIIKFSDASRRLKMPSVPDSLIWKLQTNVTKITVMINVAPDIRLKNERNIKVNYKIHVVVLLRSSKATKAIFKSINLSEFNISEIQATWVFCNQWTYWPDWPCILEICFVIVAKWKQDSKVLTFSSFAGIKMHGVGVWLWCLMVVYGWYFTILMTCSVTRYWNESSPIFSKYCHKSSHRSF